jgi:shikimate kinase
MIQLIGPGSAGKTTIGAALAERLRARFVDLDAEFRFRHCDISSYLDEHGYAAYASQNVGLFSDLVDGQHRPDIVALSSGFMTYPADVYPAYPVWRQRVASSPSTFVLLPSLQFETCVKETVHRQLGRSFARSAEREEQVIRARLPVYLRLAGRKVETMQPVETVVAELISALAAQQAAAPDGTGARARAPVALDVS